MTRIETNRLGMDLGDKSTLFIVLGTSYTKLLQRARSVAPGLETLVFAYIFDQYDLNGDSGLHLVIDDLAFGEPEENERGETVQTVRANLGVSLDDYFGLRERSTRRPGTSAFPRVLRMGSGEES